MKSKVLILIGLVIGLSVLSQLTLRASASPAGQGPAFPSPTPQADGRIIYIVKEGDTCQRIELIYGVSEAYLRSTNNLDENCSIIAGQQLVIGVGGPAGSSPSPGPSPTATPVEPTPVPVSGSGEVCVLIYDDVNGDGLRQETEYGVAEGQVSLTSLDGQYSQTRTTVAEIDPDEEEPVRTCFLDVPKGDYTVSAAVPAGYNPTTKLSQSLEVLAGDTTFMAFGAQLSSASGNGIGGGSRSPVLGIIGAAFLLIGVGLGVYTWRTSK